MHAISNSPTMNIRRAVVADTMDILDILVGNFIDYDPLVNYLELNALEYRERVLACLKGSIASGLSLIAMDDKNIAGVCVAHDLDFHVNDLPQSRKMKNYDEYLKALKQPLSSYLSHSLNIESSAILCAGYMAINPNYYGRNILQQLEEELVLLARQKNYQYLVAEFTNSCNYYVHKRAYGERLKTIHALSFKDFVNSAGEKPMQHADGESILTIVRL